jgi:archaellum biogenesis ATPase FlaH
MKDRFDLETEIMDIYNFASHIRSICNAALESKISKDEIANALEGIAVLLELKSETLTDTMCQVLKLDEYRCENDTVQHCDNDFDAGYIHKY